MDRFPQLVLFIECPSDEVDVNVHPSKNELRFKNLNFLRSKILKTFKECLADAGHKASTLNTIKAISKFSYRPNQKTYLELKDEQFKDEVKTISEQTTTFNDNINKQKEEDEKIFHLDILKPIP